MSGRPTAVDRAQMLRRFLLRHGVPQVSIEVQEGRPGPADPWNGHYPVGVMSHHIASRPTADSPTPGLALVKHGRSDLPGPLCNGYGGMDLIYRIICMGYANHPGYGGPITLDGPCGRYTIPEDNARPYVWGTEYEGGYDRDTWDRKYTNHKTGKSMTYREFMGRANAGLVEGIWYINGRGKRPTMDELPELAAYHMEHKTWAPTRKVDRHAYTVVSGRSEIKVYAKDVQTPREQRSNDHRNVNLKNMQLAARGRVKRALPGVRVVQRALNDQYGAKIEVTGLWSTRTTKFYKVHQEKSGSPAKYCDGIPGERDLTALSDGRFRVT